MKVPDEETIGVVALFLLIALIAVCLALLLAPTGPGVP